MRSNDSKSGRTRAFIIQTTAEIFNKKGFAGTSLADLTGATGLTKGSIYGNFGNKEEVAIAAFDYNYASVADTVNAELARTKGYTNKLLVYPEVYRSMIRELMARGGCPILNTSTEADDTNSKLRLRAAAAIARWEKTLIRLIKAGIAAGEFRKNVPAKQTAVAFIALIEGGIMLAKLNNDPAYMNQVLGTVEQFIGGLKR